MGHSFLAYIDESGDDGLKGPFRGGGKPGGSSNWLTVGACIMRAKWSPSAILWRDQILKEANKKTTTLHFSDLNHAQRIVACQSLVKNPLRGVSTMSHKASIPAETFTYRNQYYWYLTRHIIERISWICRDYATQGEGDGRVKITFSRRGKMSYDEFKEYLIVLRDKKTTRIYWPAIDIDGIEAFDASTSAGLQLADIIASGCAFGVDPDPFGNCECRYAEILKRVLYCRKKNYMSYGTKILPNANTLPPTDDLQRFLALFEKG